MSPTRERLVAAMLGAFEAHTDVAVMVNTSLNAAGRLLDDSRDALECFGPAPIDALAIGRFVVRRPALVPRLRDAAGLAATRLSGRSDPRARAARCRSAR